MLNVDQFIENATLEGLISAFFNFSIDRDGNFEIVSSYRSSKFTSIELTQEIYQSNNKLLSDWSGIPFIIQGSRHICKLQRSKRIYTPSQFITTLYKKIQRKGTEHYTDSEFERVLLLGLMGLRGSADPKTNFYAVDVNRDIQTDEYLDYIFKLLTNISDVRQLNLNFRELQQQYKENIHRRNTQIRVNLKWFSELIDYDLSNVNIYKHEILQCLKAEISLKREKDDTENGFMERLVIYRNKILNQIEENDQNQLNLQVQALRTQLGFVNASDDNMIQNRSSSIVNIAKGLYEDECVCCKDIYPLESRTFKLRNSDRFYLEIHHVISFSSDRNGDQIDNLVKICPSCHRALTKNRADEEYQKSLIRNILKNSPSAKGYVSNFFDDPTDEKLVNYIYDKLR